MLRPCPLRRFENYNPDYIIAIVCKTFILRQCLFVGRRPFKAKFCSLKILFSPELGIGDIGQAAAYAAYAADGVAAAVAVAAAAAAAADARRYTAVQLPWTKQAFFRRKL